MEQRNIAAMEKGNVLWCVFINILIFSAEECVKGIVTMSKLGQITVIMFRKGYKG